MARGRRTSAVFRTARRISERRLLRLPPPHPFSRKNRQRPRLSGRRSAPPRRDGCQLRLLVARRSRRLRSAACKIGRAACRERGAIDGGGGGRDGKAPERARERLERADE